MGTRGITGFIIDGQERMAYQQYDSYPEGVGRDVLNFARSITDIEEVREKVRALRVVDEHAVVTPEELAEIGKRYWEDVDTGKSWYAYLRATQGNPALIIESGFIADASDEAHGEDGWLEYSWVLDLDNREFIGYEGSLAEVEKIRASFDSLPTDEELSKAFE